MDYISGYRTPLNYTSKYVKFDMLKLYLSNHPLPLDTNQKNTNHFRIRSMYYPLIDFIKLVC